MCNMPDWVGKHRQAIELFPRRVFGDQKTLILFPVLLDVFLDAARL